MDLRKGAILWRIPLGEYDELTKKGIAPTGTPNLGGSLVTAGGLVFIAASNDSRFRAFDKDTGKKLWEVRYTDYLSDVVYNRYGIGAPAIDPETGNVYLQFSNGHSVAYTADGKLLWEHSLMEDFGRLTFPNGRQPGHRHPSWRLRSGK